MAGDGKGEVEGETPEKGFHLTLHTTVLLLSLGSWLLLFTVEISANASDGEEVFHPDRVGALVTSCGFTAVTCLLLMLWCLGTPGRSSYTSVLPGEEGVPHPRQARGLLWHYAIHGTLVLATICWICIHTVKLQHQQVWRGVLTLYSLLSLTLICFAQRQIGTQRGFNGPAVLFSGLEGTAPTTATGLATPGGRESQRKASSRTSEKTRSQCASCASQTSRWRPLFQDPSFGGEVAPGEVVLPSQTRRSKRNEWRSFVFEEQSEAILSPSSPSQNWTLLNTYQKNLMKLRGISRRHSDSDQGSARRSSFASSAEGESSFPVSPALPRIQRTQSQPSVSSGFSDVSDVIASPSSASLLRAISKDSRRISKDSRRDSRHSAESEGAMSDVSDAHVVIIGAATASHLESVYEEDRQERLGTLTELPETSVAASPARVPAESPEIDLEQVLVPMLGAPDIAQLRLPSPSAANSRPFTLDSQRTLNSEGVEGILQELKVEDGGG
ncbi:unnamed protein product [Durusdinium trenchii]|uniref:Transmembrane protein n=1 Tax=Durusdinium trenchii TaxID=1381693 RepID=A0ABP0LGL8_9DINO